MELYKVLFAGISFAFLLLTACNSSADNTNKIRSIDKIKTTDTIYAIQIDSNGDILDTFAMNRIKKNSEGVIVFNEKTSFDDSKRKIIIKKYMRDNGELFYEKAMIMTSVDTSISTHENWAQNDRIQKAISIFRGPENADTIHMTYKYENDKDGKIKKMTIFELGSSPIVERYYNQKEKPILDLYLFEGDTTEQIRYIYKGDTLVSERTLKKGTGTETILTYGPGNLLTSQNEYIKDSLVSGMIYKKDNKGNNLIRIIK